MNSEDTFRQNLLMGCGQHQAILTSHSTGPLRSAGQSSGKDCGSLVPFSGNCNPTQRLALNPAGACEISCAGNTPASLKRGSPFLSSCWKLEKGDSPGSKQESQKKSKEFLPTASSISSRCVGCSRHEKDLDSTHGPHILRKTMFSSVGTGPQTKTFSHPRDPGGLDQPTL